MQRVRVSSHQSPVHKLGQTQMTLSPKFKLSPSTSPSSGLNPDQQFGPLIPGLPDDIGLNCLLRTSIGCHSSCRAVCRRWHELFADKESLLTHRKALGFWSPLLFVFAFHRCTGKVHWLVLDLSGSSWHAITAMPCRDKVCPHGFGCVALPLEGTLLVCGGIVSDLECPLHLVLKYEVIKNRWTLSSRMQTARSFFARGVIEGKVYVAGGYSGNQFELDSAEAFDPAKGEWRTVGSMGANMACFDSAVIDGRLYVTEGWMWPFLASPIGRVYDPRTDRWEGMAVGMREGWTGQSAVIDGSLFVVSEREGMRVKVYSMESDSWDTVEGSPMSVLEKIPKPFVISGNCSRIYVVGRGLHVAIGDVERLERSCSDLESNKQRFCIRWQKVDAPAPNGFHELTPSSAHILFA